MFDWQPVFPVFRFWLASDERLWQSYLIVIFYQSSFKEEDMRLRIMQSSLNQALQATTPLAGLGAGITPVIGSVLLQASGKDLTVTATDFTTSIQIVCGAEVLEAGAICCPADSLTKLVSLLPENGVVTLHTDWNHLLVECEGNHAVFKGSAADEYPALTHIELTDTYSIHPQRFYDLLVSTVCCTSKDDSRPILTALNLNLSVDGLLLAGADGYRLAVCHSDAVFGEPFTANLPRYAVELLLKHLPDEQEVNFGFSGSHFVISYEGYQMIVASLQGNFPEYSQVIPPTASNRAQVYVKDLFQAIRTVEIFAKDDAQIMKVDISEFKGIHITGKSPAKGDADTILDGRIIGEPMVMSFNLTLWKDILKAFPQEQLVMEFTSPETPIALYPPDGREQLLYIIMPLREQK